MLVLAKHFFEAHEYQNLVIDVDSTHFDTHGNQEGAEYNGHYQTTG